jgi:hypothetical protein
LLIAQINFHPKVRRTTQKERPDNAPNVFSVFLRLLEYYRGMLFLTTNRHQDFDDAFYSRIHVTLQFGGLTPAWRTNIWREHIQRASGRNRQPGLWNKDMFEVLGEIDTNGRDIKNYTRTAYAFARAEDEDLSLHHTLIVLRNNLPDEKLKNHEETFDKLNTLERELRKEIEKWKSQNGNATTTTVASVKTAE